MVINFEEGKMYKHKRMHDTAIRILWSKDKDDATLEVYAHWYNTRYKFFIDEEIIDVKKAELVNWISFEES